MTSPFDWTNKRITINGGAGFLGSHLVEALQTQRGVSQDRITVPRSAVLDLRRWENCQVAVEDQDIVIHLAGVVGGIGINREKPGQFFYDNLIMGVQLMEAARQAGVEKFVAISTIFTYPKFAPVPQTNGRLAGRI